MNDPTAPQPSSTNLDTPTHLLQPSPKPRFNRPRAWLRSRPGRIVIPLVALLLGILIGVISLLLIGLSGDGQVVNVPSPAKGSIIVQTDKAFITDIVRMNIGASGLPGKVQNVSVVLANGDQITINADDENSVLGIGTTTHLIIVVQPYISHCLIQTRIVQVDLGIIPVTGFVNLFESNLSQEFLQKPTGLPKGFNYCTTGVRTTPAAMFIIYSATPVSR